MIDQRGQATVEWTALTLLVAAVLAGVIAASGSISGGGLPQRLACALLGADCRARSSFSATGAPVSGELRGAVRHRGGAGLGGALSAVAAPGSALLEPVGSFLERHGKTIRRVVVGTAIVVGVGVTCAAVVAAANALGAAGCASSVVTGGYAAYRNATT